MSTRSTRLRRREFLAVGAAATGALLARGFGIHSFGAAAPLPYDKTLRQLGQSLTQRQRDLVVFADDHPSRQILNAQTVLDRPHLGTLFSPSQRLLIEQLYGSMLSPVGQAQMAPTLAFEGRFEGCVLAIYGDPLAADAQVVLQGGHLMLRGGPGLHGAAFGGGMAYGHQTGNGHWRVPGNSFAHHGDAANRLYQALTTEERRLAIVAKPPHELVVQVQGRAGRFDGVRLGDLGEAARIEAGNLLATVFAAQPSRARAEAYSCIEANGGLEELRFAVYASHAFYADMQTSDSLPEAERLRRGDPYFQVWRIEGPGTIVHFKGHPHVHAYVQIVRDPARANVGAALAFAESTLEGPPVGRLLRAALRRSSGEALTFIGESIPGRICAGEVTTGLAYALDPYRNRVVTAHIRGDAMAPALRRQLADDTDTIVPTQMYRVATLDYYAQRVEDFGVVEDVEGPGVPLRQALVEHLRADGLRSAQA